MKTIQTRQCDHDIAEKIPRRTSFVRIERQLWPQPPLNTHPYWCYINTLQFHDNETNKVVWEQEIPEADYDPISMTKKFNVTLIWDKHFGWIISCELSHKKAITVMPTIYKIIDMLTTKSGTRI